MALRLNEEFVPADDGPSEIARLRAQLESGDPEEKLEAARRLKELRAEEALVACLRSPNEVTVQLATSSLWECWLDEAGTEARRDIDRGTELMSQGRLESALELFSRLAEEHPDWAEALNKKATVLYLLGSTLASLRLCRRIVSLKPHHFGAWNGLALCAAQLEKWPEALKAARKAHELQPSVQANLDLIHLAEEKIREEGL